MEAVLLAAWRAPSNFPVLHEPTPRAPSPVRPPLGEREFVPLMALIVSLGALAVDAMLPALLPIARDLGAADPKDAQLIISTMFLGFALGQLVYGPLSDSIGRKRAIYFGITLFLLGCGLSVSSTTFAVMLAGRLLQGLGLLPRAS